MNSLSTPSSGRTQRVAENEVLAQPHSIQASQNTHFFFVFVLTTQDLRRSLLTTSFAPIPKAAAKATITLSPKTHVYWSYILTQMLEVTRSASQQHLREDRMAARWGVPKKMPWQMLASHAVSTRCMHTLLHLRTLLHFRMGSHSLPIVVGWRTGIPKGQRLCQRCNLHALQ